MSLGIRIHHEIITTIKVMDISMTSQSFLSPSLLFGERVMCVCVCGKILH